MVATSVAAVAALWICPHAAAEMAERGAVARFKYIVKTFYYEQGLLNYPDLSAIYGNQSLQRFGEVYYQAKIDTPDLVFLRIVSYAIETVLQFRYK